MTKEQRLEIKLANKENIELSYNTELLKMILYLFSIFSSISIIYIAYVYKISSESIIFTSIIVFTNYCFLILVKKIVSASIHGDMLLTKNIFNKKRITSLKSIKSITSTKIFHIHFTRITFKLDGSKHSIHIIKKIDEEHVDNETIIKEAIKMAS